MLFDGYVVYRAVGYGKLEYLSDDTVPRWTPGQDEAAIYDKRVDADMDAQECGGMVALVDVRQVAHAIALIDRKPHTSASNANLIAAAPELLAACENALAIVDHRNNLQFMECAANLRSAITKAKGGETK